MLWLLRGRRDDFLVPPGTPSVCKREMNLDPPRRGGGMECARWPFAEGSV